VRIDLRKPLDELGLGLSGISCGGWA
jgi:hypothetical protein